MIDRRAALRLLPTALAATSARAAPSLPALDEGTRIWLRLAADPSGRPVIAVQRGIVWGFRPQADDLQTADFARRLYGYAGVTVRRLAIAADGSAKLRSRGWHVYTDAMTGEAIDRLLNPYTGATVDVPSFAPPATVARYGAPPRPGETAGAPVVFETRRMGEHAWLEQVRLSRFKTPDIGWFKLEADMTTFACRTRDLEDPRGGFLDPTWSHNLVAEWQTWMRMHGAPGHILFRGEGAFVRSVAEAPPELRRGIERLHPDALQGLAAELS